MKMKVNTNFPSPRNSPALASPWQMGYTGAMGRTAFRYRSYWFAPGVGEGRAAI